MLRPSARRSLILVLGGLTILFVALNFATFVTQLPDGTTWCDTRTAVVEEAEAHTAPAPEPMHMEHLQEEMARVEVEMQRVEEELRSVEMEQVQAALERAREALDRTNLRYELRTLPEFHSERTGRTLHLPIPEGALHIN